MECKNKEYVDYYLRIIKNNRIKEKRGH